MNKLVFATKKDAIEFLKSKSYLAPCDNGNFYPHGKYYLAHGEYSQPEFKAVHYKDGWGIKKLHFYYSGTLNIPTDGRCVLLDGSLVLEASLG